MTMSRSYLAALEKRHVPEAAYTAQPTIGCMEGTRERILNEIDAWIRDPEAQRICWITGMAGTGKTTIAKTVCERASADPHIILGGSFFCSRTGVAAQRDVLCVFPTLAQLLARQSAEFSRALADDIARDRDIQHHHVTVQVKQLLCTPLLALDSSHAPIVLVIDALDECGSDATVSDEESHEAVSEMLDALVTSLPSSVKVSVKFLVTSRPETQIRETSISDADLSRILRLHAVNREEVDADIHRYINETLNTKLSRKPKIRAKFTESDVQDLVRLCDGLFIVAATALKHTFSSGKDGAEAMFADLLNASRDSLSEDAASPLDRMYRIILEDAARKSATKLSAILRALATILSARMTLSISALADLLAQKPSDIHASLSRLHAVVDIPDGDYVPGLRTLHASFGDYLFTRAPVDIRIPQSLGHYTLARGCLSVMSKQLHINVSRCVSSYEPNPPTKPDSISRSLEYACLHWAHHVAGSKCTDSTAPTAEVVDTDIGNMFRPNFLFWLEVLSVSRKVSLAPGLLLMAASNVSLSPILYICSIRYRLVMSRCCSFSAMHIHSLHHPMKLSSEAHPISTSPHSRLQRKPLLFTRTFTLAALGLLLLTRLASATMAKALS